MYIYIYMYIYIDMESVPPINRILLHGHGMAIEVKPYPPVMGNHRTTRPGNDCYSLLFFKGPIEIVDLPIEHGDFP